MLFIPHFGLYTSCFSIFSCIRFYSFIFVAFFIVLFFSAFTTSRTWVSACKVSLFYFIVIMAGSSRSVEELLRIAMAGG